MGAKLGELTEYLSPGLEVTVEGKGYVLPLASAELGLWCRASASLYGAITSANGPEELAEALKGAGVGEVPTVPAGLTFEQWLLGDVHAEMVKEGVKDVYIQFCAATAYIWIVSGEDQAAAFYRAGGRPEAPRPANNRADRRAKKTGATSTGAAGKTRSRASTSGTKSRTKSAGAKKTR